MKPIIRNLLSVIRRFKLATALNILGLSVAFAAFIVIMIQLDYDYSFDKFHPDSDKIFRMEMFTPQTSRIPLISRPIAESFFESSPHIVAGGLSNQSISGGGGFEIFFHVECDDDSERNYFKEKALAVTPGFFDVFTFDIVEGSTDGHLAPGNIFIPLSMAKKFFGNEPAVGRQIVVDGLGNQTVLAVYRDFPSNSVINNCIYSFMDKEENKDNWSFSVYNTYVRVNQASDASQLIENFVRNFDFRLVFGQDFSMEAAEATGFTYSLYLTALPEIHFQPNLQYDFVPKTSRQTLLILLAIAIMIVAIAAINFTNFSTALTPMRINSLNTQLVLGSRRSTLRLSLIFEAVFISMASFLVALLLVTLFAQSPLVRLIDADLSFKAHPLIFSGSALVAALVGLLAGIYPSRYMTSFEPAVVLKGSFGLSQKGKKLRHTLIGIQYVASFALIIGATFMYLQNRFMQSNLGYDKEALITVDIGRIYRNRDAFTNRIKTYSGVEDVTNSFALLSSADGYLMWARQFRGDDIVFQVLPVHHTFLNVMDIKLTEGRNFRQEDANTEHGAWIFNETARKRFNLELNAKLEGWGGGGEIVGFMPDVKFASFRIAVEPMAFYVPGTANSWLTTHFACIKLKAGTNMRAAMSHIHATLAEFDANYTFDVRFFDEVLQRLYEKETSLGSLISLFSLMAIFISIVGVFGLVVFDSECRRKEIGIRKVLGASTLGIIIMFNKTYFRILTICFVAATPLAWYTVNRWLQNFAYKTPMYWWVYLVALAVVAVITLCTVTFQNWRVANDNPVKAIRKG